MGHFIIVLCVCVCESEMYGVMNRTDRIACHSSAFFETVLIADCNYKPIASFSELCSSVHKQSLCGHPDDISIYIPKPFLANKACNSLYPDKMNHLPRADVG